MRPRPRTSCDASSRQSPIGSRRPHRQCHSIHRPWPAKPASQPKSRRGSASGGSSAHAFEYACAFNDVDHRLTKPKHPWTNGQAKRMNRTSRMRPNAASTKLTMSCEFICSTSSTPGPPVALTRDDVQPHENVEWPGRQAKGSTTPARGPSGGARYCRAPSPRSCATADRRR